MKASFHSSDPYSGSRRHLEALLLGGSDQLAISCAYCTAAGVDFLKPHASRLRNGGSFVVVSWDKPTDFTALEELHSLIPGHLFVHYGNTTPVERKVGNSKMHSKVFYARSRNECALWTGSHNLTASAILGANCEAAILLEGQPDETPFVDALTHLKACRDEAHAFYTGMRGPDEIDLAKEPTVIIHAEGIATNSPWHLHLRAKGTQLDSILSPPASLRLYLYHPGSLSRGWQLARPHAAYHGNLTGMNLTPNHPNYSGAHANWPSAQHVVDIDFKGNPPAFGPPCADPPGVTTQALFHVNKSADLHEVWLRKKPIAKLQFIPGPESRRPADADMLRFFTKQSVGPAGELIYRSVAGFEHAYELSGEMIREEDALDKGRKFETPIRMMRTDRYLSNEFEPRAAFVYRANYRL
jgi:hypothetical protein